MSKIFVVFIDVSTKGMTEWNQSNDEVYVLCLIANAYYSDWGLPINWGLEYNSDIAYSSFLKAFTLGFLYTKL